MKKTFLLMLAILLCVSIWSRPNFTVTDTWDIGPASLGQVKHLGANRYLSVAFNNLTVYDISPTSMEKIQIVHTPDNISSYQHYHRVDNTIYILTWNRGVLIYQLLSDFTLEYQGEIPIVPGPTAEMCNTLVWVEDNIMVVDSHTYTPDPSVDQQSYLDFYDISNPTYPQHLNRYQYPLMNMVVGIHPVPGGYYFVSYAGGIFFCTSLSEFNQTNVLQGYSPHQLVRRSFWYMDKLHLLAQNQQGLCVIRCTIGEDHQLLQDWSMQVPFLEYSYWFCLEEERVTILASTNYDSSLRIQSYIPGEGEWTPEYSLAWPGVTLLALGDGYLGGGIDRTNYYNSDLQYQHTIQLHPEKRFVKIIRGRWAVAQGPSTFGQTCLSIYDLDTRQWYPEQLPVSWYTWSFRYGTDSLCAVDDYVLRVLRFSDDGNHELNAYSTSLYNVEADVWGNRIAVLQGQNNTGYLKIYEQQGTVLSEVGSYHLGAQGASEVLFYGPNHVVVSRSVVGGSRLEFYRWDSSGTITLLANHIVASYRYLYLNNNLIVSGFSGSPVIDVTNPDNPIICQYINPLGYGIFFLRISYSGAGNYLVSADPFSFNYILDSSFRHIDTFMSDRPIYRSPNRIIIQDTGSLMEVLHQDYVSVAEEMSPPLSSPLGMPYPNPFYDNVKFELNIDTAKHARVEIFNIKGQKVQTLINDYLSKGNHQLSWDARNHQGNRVASGVYILRYSSGNTSYSRRMVHIK